MMLRNTRVQTIVILAIGTMLGYVAASGKLTAFGRSEAAFAGPATTSQPTSTPAVPPCGACCSEATAKSQLVAMANTHLTIAHQGDAKKPNILFIMGDDIGMWNIGAYHRGLMAGRTPNLDK